MSSNWYYVENGERQGPIDEERLIEMIQAGVVSSEDYVWKKGYENWLKVKDVDELEIDAPEEELIEMSVPGNKIEMEAKIETETKTKTNEEVPRGSSFDFHSIDRNKNLFYILIGKDRGGSESQYGPYSLNLLIKLYKESRVNGKTFIWTRGMNSWEYLATIPIYEELFQEVPPKIEESERRIHPRKPFVAKLFFHDHDQLFEGLCRDISVGGMQILVDNVPCQNGDQINLNVHPANSEFNFTAKGKVVRILGSRQGLSCRFLELSDEARNAVEAYIKNEEGSV